VLFRWLPHRWDDADFMDALAVYEGPYVQAVRDDPGEFVRDGFQTFRALVQRATASGVEADRARPQHG
jgi:hypothetical protein